MSQEKFYSTVRKENFFARLYGERNYIRSPDNVKDLA